MCGKLPPATRDLVLDTVHGANTVKIRNYRMNENPHYGSLSEIPVYKLRQVMNHLLLKEYLAVTNDEYAIVKLTEKSKEVLSEEMSVVMKMAKESPRTGKKGAGETGTGNGKDAKGQKGKKISGTENFSGKEESMLQKPADPPDGDCPGRESAALHCVSPIKPWLTCAF